MHKYHFTLSRYYPIQIVSTIFILSMLFCGEYHGTEISSNNIEAVKQNSELSFKSISVSEHDTLWSIAKENYPNDYYDSLNDYIKEIKRCNSLVSDCINAGSSLIVPIYIPKEEYQPSSYIITKTSAVTVHSVTSNSNIFNAVCTHFAKFMQNGATKLVLLA